MFTSICCAASEVAGKATEVLTDAADKASAAVKSKANEFTLMRLKAVLEGKVNQLWEAPDVSVTLLNVELKEGVGAQDILNFHIKGLTCTAKLDIAGTAAQLTGMTAAMGTTKVADKVSEGESALTEKLGLPNLGIGAFVAAGADAARQGLQSKASDGTETKSSNFKVSVDLEKTLGVREVKATVSILDSTSDIAKYMSNGTIQKYLEEAISREVTKQCTLWQDETVTYEKAKGTVVQKAEEIAEKAKDKAKEIAEKAK
mmetsp:Transcript_92033/g.269270  ORF Transcript_92033/g.269270 Transcript_92033/m.269270 type:complete len:259 (+) Transcript_92033:57-833(+)